MKRNELIDLLKGVAIFSVVMGHAVQWLSDYDTSNMLYIVIYAFHMPLFMFLSGFVSYNPRKIINVEKRFQVLVIPFFAWFLIRYLLYSYPYDIDEFKNDVAHLLFDPTEGRWFLWILFIICALLFFAQKISKKYEEWILLLIMLFIFFVQGQISKQPFYGIPEVSWYLMFFLMGFILNKHQSYLSAYVRKIGWLSIFLFPLLISLVSVSGENVFLKYENISESLKYILYGIHTYLLSITGIFAIYTIFEKIIRYNFILKRSFLYLGSLSLEIYVTHYYMYFMIKYFQRYLPEYLYLNVITFTILAIAGSIFVQRLLKKNKYLGKILYGR